VVSSKHTKLAVLVLEALGCVFDGVFDVCFVELVSKVGEDDRDKEAVADIEA